MIPEVRITEDDEFTCFFCGEPTMRETDRHAAGPELIIVTYHCSSCGRESKDAID